MGIIGFAFTTLGMLSPNVGEIYEKAKEAITKKLPNLPPGLKEQYEIQLERLKTAPGCEFITIPGNLSHPSSYMPFFVHVPFVDIANTRPPRERETIRQYPSRGKSIVRKRDDCESQRVELLPTP